MRGRSFDLQLEVWGPNWSPLPVLIYLQNTVALEGFARHLAISGIACIHLLLACILEQENFGLTWIAYVSQWKDKGKRCQSRRASGALPGGSGDTKMVTRECLSCGLTSRPPYYLKRVQISSLNFNASDPQAARPSRWNHILDVCRNKGRRAQFYLWWLGPFSRL